MTTVRPLLKYGWLKIASCGPQTYSSTSAPPPIWNFDFLWLRNLTLVRSNTKIFTVHKLEYEFTYHEGVKGGVDLGGWLHAEMVYLSKDIRTLTSHAALRIGNPH